MPPELPGTFGPQAGRSGVAHMTQVLLGRLQIPHGHPERGNCPLDASSHLHASTKGGLE